MMKRLTLLTLLMLSLIAAKAKTLVVYYSYTNNIETVVNDLKTQIQCDVLEIEPAEKGLKYEANNYAIGSEQLNRINANPNDLSSYPAIEPVSVNLADYDCIIIGTPLWWSQMATPMQSFLFQYGAQMASKHIGMIVSSSSSGISGVVSRAKELILNGQFFDTDLWVRSSQVSDCHSLIEQWLSSINYNQVTGIREVSHQVHPSDVKSYRLNGQLAQEGDKGIIITNGKKRIVK